MTARAKKSPLLVEFEVEKLKRPQKEMPFSLRYSDGETGWAYSLGDGLAVIANIPMAENLNIDDLVEMTTDGDLPRIKRVLQRTFNRKTILRYPAPHQENFSKLVKYLHARGCKVEGMYNGVCVVAHTQLVNAGAFAAEALR